MVEIPLTHGKVALIDDEDIPIVAGHKWRAKKDASRYRVRWYAYSDHPTISMHVLIVGRKGVDHVNGDGLDNQRCNLRLATPAQNSANKHKVGGLTSSRFKGVTLHRQTGKWQAAIGARYLGLFADEHDAADAYRAAAEALYGDFARVESLP